jgi:hypothetical protein
MSNYAAQAQHMPATTAQRQQMQVASSSPAEHPPEHDHDRS